jgi:hypothetical protein
LIVQRLSWKNSTILFKDDILEFLGMKGSISSHMSISAAMAEVAHFEGDATFAIVAWEMVSKKIRKKIDGKYVVVDEEVRSNALGIDFEMEANLSVVDLRRFAAYNVIFSANYDCEFRTFVLTAEEPEAEIYEVHDMRFAPTILKHHEKDGEAVLNDMLSKLEKGEKVNKLELAFLPMTGGKMGSLEKVLAALDIISKMAITPEQRKRLTALVLLCANKKLSAQEKAIARKEASKLSLIDRESLLEWADEELLKELKEKEEVIKVKDEALKDKDGFINFLLKKSGSSKEDYEAFLKSGNAVNTVNP